MKLGVYFPGCCIEVRRGRERRRGRKAFLPAWAGAARFYLLSSSLLKYVMYIIFKQPMVTLKVGLHVFN